MSIQIIIVILVVTIGGGAAAYFLLAKGKKGEVQDIRLQLAQDIVNVIDIKDKVLYTKDGYEIMYIKIQPISVELLSEREKKQLCRTLTAELSAESQKFIFLAVSRPVNIAPIITQNMQLMAESNDIIQKNLLRDEIMEMSNFAMSGDVVERQFYIRLWDKAGSEYGDLNKRCYEMQSKFESCSIRTEILGYHEIVRLCNLVNNPAYTNLENADIEPAMPFID